MTKDRAKKVISTIKLPKRWKVEIKAYCNNWRDSFALTDYSYFKIRLNPWYLKYMDEPQLLTVIRHEIGHILQAPLSVHCNPHNREWYRNALKNGFTLEDEYNLDKVVYERKNHRRASSFKQFLKYAHKEYGYYIPKNYGTK